MQATNNIVSQFGSGSTSLNAYSWLANFYNGVGIIPIDSLRNNLHWTQWRGVSPGPQFLGGGGYTDGATTQYDLTWAQWVAFGGTGVNADPLFVNTFGYESDQGLLRGDLQSGSPAINAGGDERWLIDWLNTTYSIDPPLPWEDIGDATFTIDGNKVLTGPLGVGDGNARVDHADSVTIGAYNPPWRR